MVLILPHLNKIQTFFTPGTILLGKVVNVNSCHSNPSTLLLRMVSINLFILQQWLIVRYPHLTRSSPRAACSVRQTVMVAYLTVDSLMKSGKEVNTMR